VYKQLNALFAGDCPDPVMLIKACQCASHIRTPTPFTKLQRLASELLIPAERINRLFVSIFRAYARSRFSIRVSGFHSLELFTPFVTLGSQRAYELKISVVQTGMFLVNFGFSLTNVG
jgi:hypothetical protein